MTSTSSTSSSKTKSNKSHLELHRAKLSESKIDEILAETARVMNHHGDFKCHRCKFPFQDTNDRNLLYIADLVPSMSNLAEKLHFYFCQQCNTYITSNINKETGRANTDYNVNEFLALMEKVKTDIPCYFAEMWQFMTGQDTFDVEKYARVKHSTSLNMIFCNKHGNSSNAAILCVFPLQEGESMYVYPVLTESLIEYVTGRFHESVVKNETLENRSKWSGVKGEITIVPNTHSQGHAILVTTVQRFSGKPTDIEKSSETQAGLADTRLSYGRSLVRAAGFINDNIEKEEGDSRNKNAPCFSHTSHCSCVNSQVCSILYDTSCAKDCPPPMLHMMFEHARLQNSKVCSYSMYLVSLASNFLGTIYLLLKFVSLVEHRKTTIMASMHETGYNADTVLAGEGGMATCEEMYLALSTIHEILLTGADITVDKLPRDLWNAFQLANEIFYPGLLRTAHTSFNTKLLESHTRSSGKSDDKMGQPIKNYGIQFNSVAFADMFSGRAGEKKKKRKTRPISTDEVTQPKKVHKGLTQTRYLTSKKKDKKTVSSPGRDQRKIKAKKRKLLLNDMPKTNR